MDWLSGTVSSIRLFFLAATMLLFGATSALAQSQSTACTATLTGAGAAYRLHVPYLIFSNFELSADFETVPASDGSVLLKVSNYAPISDASPFASCSPAYLSSNLYLSIPEIAFGAGGFETSMLVAPGSSATDLRFRVVGLNALSYISANQSIAGGVSIPAGQTLVIKNTGGSTSTTIDVQGDLICKGDIEVWDSPASVRFNISGNVELGCNLRFAKANPASSIVIVAGGKISVLAGFVPPATGHVVITDSASLIKSPEAYAADANSDDGVTPMIMPTSDSSAVQQSVPMSNQFQEGVPCTTTHVLAGGYSPPQDKKVLPQRPYDGTPVVLATWFRCNVEVNNVNVDPPTWDPPSSYDKPDKIGANGRKGLTLNLYSGGKVTFVGSSTFKLMDGGKGQDQKITGNPATATAGHGGASGDLKIAAAGGIDFATGATLTIVPGRGGDGGKAEAYGTAGADGCPGLAGAAASATGGNGADSKKVLKARGFDPTGKVIVADVRSGNGGSAFAYGGNGGNGTPGKCDGGSGGNATAQGGKGGDSSFTYSGAGSVGRPQTMGGDAGSALSQSGRGGNGGNKTARCDVGGSGGKGGASTAKSGVIGIGTQRGNNGTASAGTGKGDGGFCGNYLSSNGTGGNWSEYVGGFLQNSGQFSAGNRDCSCTIAGTEPRISVTPGEFVFAHDYGISSCPQLIGSATIANTGSGSFSWRLGSLPGWLSANKTSGVSGDTIQWFFTCTDWTPSMVTSVSITGTNTSTGQALSQGASVPISGAVRQ